MAHASKFVKKYYEQSVPHSQGISSEFVSAIQNWVKLDDAIREKKELAKKYNKDAKEFEKQKCQIGNQIVIYMKQHHIENKDINISGGGKIRYKVSQRMIPTSKAYVCKRIHEFWQCELPKTPKNLINFIYENREKTISAALSRTKPRNK